MSEDDSAATGSLDPRAVQANQSSRRRDLVGATIWLLSVQFFISQWLAARAWKTPYNLGANYISDLGAVHCACYPFGSTKFVCSPLHSVMNASFVIQGIIMILGVVLVRAAFPANRIASIGLGLIALAGAGVIAVGFAPEDANAAVHRTGAAIDFISGNLGLVAIGIAWLRGFTEGRRFAAYTLAAGWIGFAALTLFVCGISLGIGVGGMERVVAYPLPTWLIVAGYRLLFGGVRSGIGRGQPQSGNSSRASTSPS